MKKGLDTKNYKILKIAIYIVMACMLMIYMQDYSFQNHSDDAVYRETFLHYKNWVEWVTVYYQSWCGRIAIDTMLVFLLNLPVDIWRALVSVSILLTIHYIVKIAKLLSGTGGYGHSDISNKGERKKNAMGKVLQFALPFLLFFYFRPMFNDWVFTWCTGSANYLFPGCCLLISLYPVLLYVNDVPVHWKDILLAALAGILAGSSEQTGAIFMVYSTILLLQHAYKKKSISVSILLLSIFIDGMTLISIFAPGNQVRAQMEVSWFPSYPMFGFMDKLILGMQHYVGHMYRMDTVLFVIIMYVMLFILNHKSRKNELFVLLGFVMNSILSVLSSVAFSEWYINPQWFLYVFWLLILFITPFYNAWLLYGTFRERSGQLAVIVAFLYLAAVSSCVVLGFSPTVYASGIRIFYIYQLLVYALDIILVYQGFRSSTRCFLTDLWSTAAMGIAAAGCIGFIFLFEIWNQNKVISLNQMPERDNVQIENASAIEKNGYLQISFHAKDNDCRFSYNNWVNGKGNSPYLNAKMAIKKDEGYYILSTYPKPNDGISESVELRGYIPIDVVEDVGDKYEIALIIYDMEGEALGYSRINLDRGI